MIRYNDNINDDSLINILIKITKNLKFDISRIFKRIKLIQNE